MAHANATQRQRPASTPPASATQPVEPHQLLRPTRRLGTSAPRRPGQPPTGRGARGRGNTKRSRVQRAQRTLRSSGLPRAHRTHRVSNPAEPSDRASEPISTRLANAFHVDGHEGILFEEARPHVVREKVPRVVPRKRVRHLRQIVRPEGKEIRVFGDLIGRKRRPRHLDHRANRQSQPGPCQKSPGPLGSYPRRGLGAARVHPRGKPVES